MSSGPVCHQGLQFSRSPAVCVLLGRFLSLSVCGVSTSLNTVVHPPPPPISRDTAFPLSLDQEHHEVVGFKGSLCPNLPLLRWRVKGPERGEDVPSKEGCTSSHSGKQMREADVRIEKPAVTEKLQEAWSQDDAQSYLPCHPEGGMAS